MNQTAIDSSQQSSSESARKNVIIPSLFRSASLIAIVTIVSKILGLIRDQMIAHAYGATLVSDAYYYAFQLPSFSLVLLGGLGGPFHTATVSVLSKIIKDNENPSERAQALTNTFITLTGIVFALLSILTFFYSRQIIGIIAGQAPLDLQNLAAHHLRWMSPMIFLGGLIGIFYGVANVYHRFFWPSLSPSAINVTLILWLWVLGKDPNGYSLAISTLLGGILQVALQLPDYFKTGFRLFPAFKLKDPDLKTMGELLFPATIGTSIGQLNIYVAMFFTSQLMPGAWTAFQMGNRLIQLPIGVLIIAMIVPLFPRFSRWAGEKDFDSIRSSFRDGVLALWLFSFPITALIFLVGQQSIGFLFQRGAFTAQDTALVYSVLAALSLSIIPYMLRDGITRVFYAFNDSKTPLLVGLFSIGVNAVFNALLVKPFGVAGIAFSQVIVTICNALLLSLLIKRHIKSMGFSSFIPVTLKLTLATAIASVAAFFALQLLHPFHQTFGLTTLHLYALIEILVGTFVMALVYAPMLLLLKVDLASRLINKVLKRQQSSI